MTRPTEKLAIVISLLVPLAGVFFLGWSAATAIYLLWLDAYLVSFRLIPVTMYLARASIKRDPEESRNPVIDWITLPSLALFAWAFLSLPVTIAGGALAEFVSLFKQGGFEGEAYGLILQSPWAFAVLLGARFSQASRELAVARATGEPAFAGLFKGLAALVAYRAGVLFVLGGASGMLVADYPQAPRVLLVLAVFALIAVELHALDWFQPARASFATGNIRSTG